MFSIALACARFACVRPLRLAPLPAAVALALGGCGGSADIAPNSLQGQQFFRYETFGDEAKWTDVLHMNEVIESSIDPTTALAVGLKVDTDALPASVVAGISNGSISLTSPAPGMGRRLDGWPNRDLDPGAIIALSPALTTAQKAVYNSWGKGMYDPRYNIDGLSKPVVIPPAFGLFGVDRITYTGDGPDIMYWNRYVAVTQMGGLGIFTEPLLGISITNGAQDLVSDRLPSLQAYQLSLGAPPAPAGSFDPAAAARGKLVFEGAGTCSSCHAGPNFTDARGLSQDPLTA